MLGANRKRKWFDPIMYQITSSNQNNSNHDYEDQFIRNIFQSFLNNPKNKMIFLRCVSIVYQNRDGYADAAILGILNKIGIDAHFSRSLISCMKCNNKDDMFYKKSIHYLLIQLQIHDVFLPRETELFTNQESDYRNIKFEDLDLCESNWSYTILDKVSFVRSRLNNANFTGCILTHANFQGANLSGANLTQVTLNPYLNLTHQIFQNEGYLPFYLSYLTAIFSIDDDYMPLKIKFLEAYITKYNEVSKHHQEKIIGHYHTHFCSEISRNIAYLNSIIILEFVEKHLYIELMNCANKSYVCFNKNQSRVLFKIFEYYKNSKRYFLSNSFLLSQLIYHLKTDSSIDFQIRASFLEQIYIKALPRDVISKCCLSLYGSLDCSKEEQEQLLAESMCLISNDLKHVFFIHYHYYEKFLIQKPHNHIEWSYYCYLKKASQFGLINPTYNDNTGRINLLEIFDPIPIFKQAYLESVYSNQITHLIAAMDLGCFTHIFDKALLQNHSNYKCFSEDEEQIALAQCFAHFIEGDIRSLSHNALNLKITPNFAETILRVFQFSDSTPQKKFLVFCCLATIFTRLSAREFFGTEHASPLALRNFAIALLNQACMYKSQYMRKDIKEWKDELAGVGSKICCTSLLFDSMRIKLTEESNSLFHMMLPVAWL